MDHSFKTAWSSAHTKLDTYISFCVLGLKISSSYLSVARRRVFSYKRKFHCFPCTISSDQFNFEFHHFPSRPTHHAEITIYSKLDGLGLADASDCVFCVLLFGPKLARDEGGRLGTYFEPKVLHTHTARGVKVVEEKKQENENADSVITRLGETQNEPICMHWWDSRLSISICCTAILCLPAAHPPTIAILHSLHYHLSPCSSSQLSSSSSLFLAPGKLRSTTTTTVSVSDCSFSISALLFFDLTLKFVCYFYFKNLL